MSSRPPAQQAARKVKELAIAEQRGADLLRARVREVLEDRRRVVRQGDQQIEVVEVSAIIALLDDDGADDGDDGGADDGE